MEIIKGKKLKTILLDNNNWWSFFTQHRLLIRESIVSNIVKVLSCGTEFLGYHLYQCDNCHTLKAVNHTCKSRFCPSCGKKATDNWIQAQTQILPQTNWQHITFTFPQKLQDLFWLNRNLLNATMPIPEKIITEYAKKLGVIPGIFVAMHTFGRDLKKNLHYHLSTTLSGLSLDKTRWMSNFRFNRPALVIIKQQWTDAIISLLRQEYMAGNLILPNTMSQADFLNFIDTQPSRPSWVVHFSKASNNHHRTVKYLGRYLKRPPIGETRIKHYDGQQVTFSYFDHHDKSEHSMTLPVFDFIKRLINHIPDRYFRVVRYYNWLSTRTRNKYLPFIYNAVKQIIKNTTYLSWRELFTKTFGRDPLLCPCCKKNIMRLVQCVYKVNCEQLQTKHQQVANLDNHCYA